MGKRGNESEKHSLKLKFEIEVRNKHSNEFGKLKQIYPNKLDKLKALPFDHEILQNTESDKAQIY